MKNYFLKTMLVFILGIGLFASCQKESLEDLGTEVTASLEQGDSNEAATLRASTCNCTITIVKRGRCSIRFTRSEGCATPLKYTWTYPSGATTDYHSLSVKGANGIYTLTATDANGCVATTSANIQDCEIVEPECCIFTGVRVRPTPSCTGAIVTHAPLNSDEEICAGTTFEYTLCDEDGNELAPPIVTTDPSHRFLGLDLCNIYYVKGKVRKPGCPPTSYSAQINLAPSCCDDDTPQDCCILYRPTVRPTPSCTGVTVTHSPLNSNDEICEGTTFEYTLCDANGNVLAPPIVTTDPSHRFLGLNLCNIYYVKGKIKNPDCPATSYSVQINLAPSCC